MRIASTLMRPRHEIKYLIPPSDVVRIRRSIAPYTEPDAFTARSPKRRYPISSLYLDSPAFSMAASTLEGERDRVKLRIRRYLPPAAPLDDAPCFFEIKRKRNGIVHKQRAKLDPASALVVLRDGAGALRGIEIDDPSQRLALSEFVRLRARLGAVPAVNVHYEREAHQDLHGTNSVRVTFDYQLSATPYRPDVPFGASPIRAVPLRGVILEIKFTGTYPRWIGELVRTFRLHRRAVPKYVLCLHAGEPTARFRGALQQRVNQVRA